MLVQGVTDYAIYMLDPQGRVTSWNSGAATIKGYDAAEIIGEHFSRFYTEQDRATGEPARALDTALREGKYEAEAQRVRKGGAIFWAHVVIDPIRNDDGRHIGFAKITRDVTEKRETQKQLEETRDALFQSQKLQALGELTGGIAHDFNNLLTVIRGSADLLRREGLSTQKRDQYLAAIVETADHAATLTSHLLAFGRRQALKPEVIDLNVRLDAFAEMLSRTLGGKIEVSLDLSPALGLVEVDSTQLETALLNAAINARDAMPGGGTLTLSTRNIDDAAGKMVCVALSDTGEGMTPEVLDRVFEPFFTTKVIGKGTGLGLSQIHGFAAQAGGRVELTSVPEKGTTVHILLPRTDKPATTAVTLRSGSANGDGRTLLLVEDNAAVRDFAHGLLTELGYRVISVDCAETAVERLEAERIDLVFSDVVMPGLSGVELERIVRARFPDIPVLLASGYSEEVALGTAGDLTVLPKPYGAESLAAALAEVVGAKNRPLA
ncbi:PAS domain-containing sensor histidine kinase [Sphingomonas sp. So64.6b]|uniref:PAS domain-containing sensor histidine kinase n=1 Tax=Sphingomonas sp. So64.6b TaxID=2997354 RepID=UPI001FCEB4D0|nr:PAS domain-containing sensor histidine kinase [Sphingomonas sp. So64.6b]